MINNTSQTRRGSWLSRAWESIIRPHPSVTDVGDYQRARLFAGITFLLSITIVFVLIYVAQAASTPEEARIFNVMLGLGIGTVISYVLSRTRYYMIGVIILLGGLSTGGYVIVLLGGGGDQRASVLSILPIAFIIGMAMLNTRGNILMGVFNVLFPLALPFLLPASFDFQLVGVVAGIALFMGALAVLNSALRERIERGRLAETREINQQLQEASVNLEQRVADRTRDLALASELGRRISLVRDMDTLLSDTVSLIQEHFNLYYTQIYLVDQHTRSLVLKAGSGETGKEMLRRSHRLPMDATSINGMAVTERRTVVVSDTQSSPTFRTHELLPDTRSEMAIPLISGERVLGVIDLQASRSGALTSDNQAVFETVAAQMATALVNVDLFGQVQRSLSDLEARSRKEVFEGWRSYLDGIEVKEHFGYTYDAGNIAPLEEKLAETADVGALTAPMQVSGAPIGKMQLVAERSWSAEDLETVQAVSNMVAQQIENLRLLDQAEQYRRDAEDAARRLSRQEWGEFIEENQGAEMAYVYTGAQVQAMETGQNGHVDGLSFDIKVQDEAIGEFGLDGVNSLTAEEEEILQAVSSQLGAHLENLRLYTASQQELVERRRTEEALRESEKDLSNALRLAHMGNWELDLSTMLFTFNDDFYAMLRTTAEAEGGYQLTPEQYGKYVHPDELHVMADETRRAIETTDPNYLSQVEHRFFYADGEMGYLSVLITVEMDENGKVIKTRGVNQDITERRRAEDALRKSEKDLSDALRLAHMGYWELDLSTMLFTFNDDFYAMLRTTAEAEGGYHLTPEQYGKFVHPDEVHIMADETRKAIETTDPNYVSRVEHRFFYADGEMGYLGVLITVEMDENGKVIKTRGVNQDITERRRAEDALRKSEKDLSGALRLAHMGYWELDLSTMLFTFNDDFYAMLRTTAEAEGGYHLTPEQYGKFLHPDDMYIMIEGTRNAIETTDPNFTQNLEHRCFYADGVEGYMSVLVTIVKDENGKTIKTRGVNQDITERRRIQDMLIKRAGELATVAEISTKVTAIQDPDEMLQTVVDLAKPVFNLYHAHIYLLNEAGDTLVLTNGAGEVGQKMVAEGRRISLDAEKSLVARAARTLEGVTVNDVRQDPDFLAHPLLPETRAEMAVPVVSGGKLLGVLDVQSEEVGKFTEEDVSIQTTLASQIGSHLESIRLFANVQRELAERQRAQEALRRSEESLSEALRIARIGHWEYDVADDVFITNDQIYSVMRTTAEALGGYRVSSQKFMEHLVYPEDISIITRQIATAIQSKSIDEAHEIEYRYMFGDGEIGYVSVMIQAEKDENGNTIKALGTNQDITERKRADIALEEQRRTLQVILNNMPVAVLAKDAKTYEFVMWNQAAEELFGMKSQDVIGKNDYDFYPKEQADAFRAADIEVVKDRKRINIPEEVANNAKGETRILQTVKVPVVDENDQPVLLLVVTADITEVKQAQDTIAKRARELEKVASVSTSVSTIQTPDEMLQTVVDLTKESFDLYHAHIYLFDEAEKMLVLNKGAGEIGRQMVAEGRKIALGAEKSLVARAARSRHGVTVNDVRQDPDFLPHPLLPDTHSEMAVPMIAGDHLLGVIDVQDEEVGRFSQEDINILTTLAAQVAISLQNARSFARAQRQAEREALINIISERIQATNSVENALQVAVREIGRALGAQHTAIRLGLERKNTDQS